MTHASLFSGIGGFDLAAEWAGWTNLFNCEIDPFCQKVLKYHFPNAEQYSDIRKTDFTIWRGRIDVLTGGFPCQPFSLAGKRKGTEDERHLWPEMLRAIREIRPRWVVGENVYGILNWSDGLVFEQVCSDLEHEGYEVQAYILPAAGVGAPHKRDRVWFVARRADAGIESMQGSKDIVYASRITSYTRSFNRDPRRPESTGQLRSTGFADESDDVENPVCVRRFGADHTKEEPNAGQFRVSGAGDNRRICGEEGVTTNAQRHGGDKIHKNIQSKQSEWYGVDCVGGEWVVADTHHGRLSERYGKSSQITTHTRVERRDSIPNWDNFPTQSPVRRRDDGFSSRLDREAVFEGIKPSKRKSTVARWREESIKGFGNAVVPLVPLQIFETIKRIEATPDRGIKPTEI